MSKEIIKQHIPSTVVDPTGIWRFIAVWSFNPAEPDVIRFAVTDGGEGHGLSLRHLLTGTEAEVRLSSATVFPCGMELLVRFDFPDYAATYAFPMKAVELFITRILQTFLPDAWVTTSGSWPDS